MEFIFWTLNIAWKVLGLCIGWMLFRYILKNGSGTFRDILDTITIGIKAMGHAIRKKMLNYLKKESEAEDQEEKKIREDYKTYRECCEGAGFTNPVSYEEFKRVVMNHEPLILD
jgi:hypothetical protein